MTRTNRSFVTAALAGAASVATVVSTAAATGAPGAAARSKPLPLGAAHVFRKPPDALKATVTGVIDPLRRPRVDVRRGYRLVAVRVALKNVGGRVLYLGNTNCTRFAKARLVDVRGGGHGPRSGGSGASPNLATYFVPDENPYVETRALGPGRTLVGYYTFEVRSGVRPALLSLAPCPSVSGAQWRLRPQRRAGRAETLRPLATGVVDPAAVQDDPALAISRIRDAGARVVGLVLPWVAVAPERRPASFNPSDPDDPSYAWSWFDEQVRLSAASGLDVLAIVDNAPAWAQRRPPNVHDDARSWYVDRQQFAAFATAAARRYSGTHAGIPRVRLWQAWNEPNYSGFLNPQLASQLTRPPALPLGEADIVGADQYRSLLNVFADAVHAVDPTNVVVAGGLLPFGAANEAIGVSVPPLQFMRKLLCMSSGAKPVPTCGDVATFDVWGVHPYTVGGPTVQASLPDDVSIGDLPEVNRLLRAAAAAGHIRSARPVEFWATEFGWDTKPPDAHGVPLSLHTRWVAEALYRMWSSGISMVIWFGLRDDDLRGRPEGSVIQAGLYFRGTTPAADLPKPSLAAFRFPFVAFPVGVRARVWGRLPPGVSGDVVVDQSSRAGWRRLARLRPGPNGVFQAIVDLRGSGPVIRARLANGSLTAVPFSLRKPRDIVVNPFGGPVG